jgi:hypothetical protein
MSEVNVPAILSSNNDPSVALEVSSEPPPRASACAKSAGNFFPLAAARRKIPAHAIKLKEYFCGADLSSTCDNEHTLASLGQAEILGVNRAPGD